MTKADAAAADRLLKAAVKRAAAMIRERRQYPAHVITIPSIDPTEIPADWMGGRMWVIPNGVEIKRAPDPVVAMLTAATESADLLLTERAS